MLDDRPPHPGPQPPLFRYPFAEASAAQAAADALADLLGQLRDTHDEAWADAQVGFDGRTAGDMRGRIQDLLGQTDDVVDVLRRQAGDIADEIQLAHQRQAENVAARQAWANAHAAWADWRPSAPTGPR